jgi:RimJ/RimL family protein N-acetyltransferase
LDEIKNNHPEIVRVELFCRANNQQATALYQKLGFVVEGYLKNCILDSQGQLESNTIMGWINPNYQKI